MEENNTVVNKMEKGLTAWLFNPFHYIAGGKALIIGLALIVLAGIIGSFTNSHFDGIIDFHTGKVLPLWFDITAGMINWIIMGVLITIGGLIISKSRFRIIDVFGTQALARFPTVITSLVALLPGYKSSAERIIIEKTLQSKLNYPTDLTIFLVVLIVNLLMTIWMVYLMYRSFAISCNVKGAKAVLTFIAAIFIGEIVSKVIFISMILKPF